MILGFDGSKAARMALSDDAGAAIPQAAKLKRVYGIKKTVDVNAGRLTATATKRASGLRSVGRVARDGADMREALSQNAGGIQTAMLRSYFGSPYAHHPSSWGRRANSYGSGGAGLGAYEIATLEGLGEVRARDLVEPAMAVALLALLGYFYYRSR